MRLLRRLARLDRSARRALVAAAILIPAVRIALWLLPFRVVARSVERLARPRRELDRDPAELSAIVWAVRAVARRLRLRKPCLTEALVGMLLLRRAGHPASIRIGVVRDERPRLDAHAWLECDGAVLLGGTSAPERYVPLFTMGAGP